MSLDAVSPNKAIKTVGRCIDRTKMKNIVLIKKKEKKKKVADDHDYTFHRC